MKIYFDERAPVTGTQKEKDAAARELWELARKKEKKGGDIAGVLTPDDVIARASKPVSALHRLFEWDDALAAHEHRKAQARRLIRGLRVKYEEPQPPIRLVNTVRLRGEDRERGYVRVDRAMAYQPDREYVLRQALAGIRAWRNRYSELSEFSAIFDAIDQLELDDKMVAVG